jgi:hypothetical protein
MNIVTMLAWIKDIIVPYTRDRPCALILDSYNSHWADDVIALAEEHNIQLIQVPVAQTSILQPLDVNFNGPMLASRRKIAHARKLENPFALDSYQATVERSQIAYGAMTVPLTLKAWQDAYLID